MANKKLDELRLALASMWGYEAFAELLPQDQADIDSFINAAYFDIYAPVDGSKAYWPEKYHSDIFLAPVNVTLGVTNGSTVVTGHTFNAKYAGSFVKIGERFFRYSGKVGSDENLVQPWDGETGSYAAIVYHNAIALPWQVVRFAGMPSILGVGILGALPDADGELLLRTEPAFDFQPRNNRSVFALPSNQFRQNAFYDVGDPRMYHVDQASVATTFTLGNRLHVYPIPEKAYTFELRANICPNPLTNGEDIPAVPANAVDNILLPIAREKLALNSAGRRYTGPNVGLLSKAASDARAQLKGLRRVQSDTAQSIRMQRNW